MTIRPRTPAAPGYVVLILAVATVLGIGVLVSRNIPESYDAGIMLQVTENLIEHGSVEVKEDVFKLNIPYASYGIGFSLLMVPAAVVAKWTGADVGAATMLTNPVLLAILVGLLMIWARLADASLRAALATSGLVILGTLTLPLAATGFSELAVAVGVTGGLVAVQGAIAHRRWAGAVAGASAGLALLCRSDSLVIVVPFLAVGVWLASGRSLRTVITFAITFAPCFALWAAYNHHRFGAPWRLGYAGYGFTTPFLKGFYGLTLSPGRGVLWFVPLVVLAAAGVRAAYRRAPVVCAVAVGMFVARPLFYASWHDWNGGVTWGPRFLVPAMPLLAVGVLEVVRGRRSRALIARTALAVVAVLSLTVQVVGTAVAYEAFFNEKVVPRAPPPARDVEFHFFSWRDSPILGQTRFLLRGHGLASRYLSPDVNVAMVFTLLSAAATTGAAAWVLATRADRENHRLTSQAA